MIGFLMDFLKSTINTKAAFANIAIKKPRITTVPSSHGSGSTDSLFVVIWSSTNLNTREMRKQMLQIKTNLEKKRNALVFSVKL